MAKNIASLEKVTNLQLVEIVRPFATGVLEALIRKPDSAENYVIPPKDWETAFFPERIFLVSEIDFGHGDYWDGIAGRTPIVRRRQFEEWLLEVQSKIRGQRGIELRPVLALRQCLIGLVMDGVVTSSRAESLAAKWGQLPFETSPSASKYTPMTEPRRSLAMSVAWISMRCVDAVRDSWPAYRTECWEWFAIDRRLPLDGGADWWIAEGAELRSLDARSVMDLGILEALDAYVEAKVLSVKSAREDLWRNLGEGAMQVFLVGVMQAYTARGESELSLSKLSSYLTARYGTLADAKTKLGSAASIKAAFVDIQRELYSD